MKQKDLLDQLQSDWQSERPDLDSSGMGIVGRIVLLGEYMKKNANEVLEPLGIGYTDLDVLATLRRSGSPYTLRPADLLKGDPHPIRFSDCLPGQARALKPHQARPHPKRPPKPLCQAHKKRKNID